MAAIHTFSHVLERQSIVNILITGGLLGIAVLAILGAILLGIGEDRAVKAQKAKANGAPAALLPQQSQSRQLPDQGPVTPAIPATPVLTHSTGQLPALTGRELLASLDGQAREITSELRTLAQHAGELEQRLNHLSELLERHQPRQPAGPGQLYAPEADTQAL
jgi:hypothetical protein